MSFASKFFSVLSCCSDVCYISDELFDKNNTTSGRIFELVVIILSSLVQFNNINTYTSIMSDFEDDSYSKKKSEVYLAYVDAPIKQGDDVVIEDTFVGSKPVWLHPESQPDAKLLECGSCHSHDNMRLLLQAFAPVDEDQMGPIQDKLSMNRLMKYVNGNDDRVLYVFMCTKCHRQAGSIKCIRGVKRNGTAASATQAKLDSATAGDAVPGAKDFKINPFDLSGAAANPFASTSGAGAANPFASATTPATKADAPSKTTTPEEPSKKVLRKLHDEKKDLEYDSAHEFKGYQLYVEQETFQNKPDHLKLPKNLKIDKEALELTGEDELEDLDRDPVKLDPRTEKLSQFLDDEVFQKFQEVVGYNPLQVLRYDLGGKPLYYAETKVDLESVIPKPGFNPSSKRVFEMQLMPKLILDLEKEDQTVSDGMEWGTILVFTDAENYTPKFDDNNVGYVEECVRVQWESRT